MADLFPAFRPVVAFTGHRPHKLCGRRVEHYVRERIREELLSLRPRLVISGMALGVDQWAAQIALEMQLPLLAAVPFLGQDAKWTKRQQAHYRRLLDKAAEVVIVSSGGYTKRKMDRRNEYMVHRCDVLIAVWNGTAGGTANCVHYAQIAKRDIRWINPSDTSTIAG
jgi:uncharacterized phage-like protein YoqJ